MSKLSFSNSVFKSLSIKQTKEITKLFGSHCFIVNENSILQRANSFTNSIKKLYKNSIAAYSIKTQPIPYIIEQLYNIDFVPEVVSSDEFNLIEKLNILDKGVIFNGPYKTDESLKKAILSGSRINCDNYDEILRVAKIAKKMKSIVKIGLRVCDNTNVKNWSRFGFSLDKFDDYDCEIFKIINKIEKIPELKLSGIHCHIGTNIRDLFRFRVMSSNMAKLAEIILDKYGKILDWIDLGGGLAGISPTLDEKRLGPYLPFNLELYAESVISPLKEYLIKTNNQTKLIFELGRSLFDYSSALITTVVGSRETSDNSQTLIVDAGIHVAPTSQVYKHPIYSIGMNSNYKKTLLLGPSCMQHDFLSKNTFLSKLEFGDQILVDALGAYNISRNNEFINLKPAVVLIDINGEYKVLRNKSVH